MGVIAASAMPLQESIISFVHTGTGVRDSYAWILEGVLPSTADPLPRPDCSLVFSASFGRVLHLPSAVRYVPALIFDSHRQRTREA